MTQFSTIITIMPLLRLAYTRRLVNISIFIVFTIALFLRQLRRIPVPAPVNCTPGLPCSYPERVDFRIIVITYNRPESLIKLLRSINTVELDFNRTRTIEGGGRERWVERHIGRLEIWIDRDQEGRVDNRTLEIASGFHWKQGPTRVHVQPRNIGIMGQWIDTWAPPFPSPSRRHSLSHSSFLTFFSSLFSSATSPSSPTPHTRQELALILEDDLSVSPYIYRWIRAVHRFYSNHSDYMGITIKSDDLRSHDDPRSRTLSAPKDHTVFMYKAIGTWGFAPSPGKWRNFQVWFHKTRGSLAFPERAHLHPYIDGTVLNRWYKKFELEGTQDTMWEMWVDYYSYINGLYTVYNNLAVFTGQYNSCLCINRREVGLHFRLKGREDLCGLLQEWKDEFVVFPTTISRLDWNGLLTE